MKKVVEVCCGSYYAVSYTHLAYMVVVHVDSDGNMVITQNPTISSTPTKSSYEPKTKESDGTVDAATTAVSYTHLDVYKRQDYTFTADSESMKVQIAFTFDASELGGKELVTFEELYDLSNPDEPTKVTEHKDIEDDGQTVTITEVPETPEEPTEPEQPTTEEVITETEE